MSPEKTPSTDGSGLAVVDHVVSSSYRHATGPLLSRFLTALRDETAIYGGRCVGCDRVLVPLDDHCPICGETIREAVRVGPGGIVVGMTVVSQPMPLAAIDPPFAFLRVRLDGATSDFVHVARDPRGIERGTRVRPVWAAERTGSVRDIVCFEPEGPQRANDLPPPPVEAPERPPATLVATRLDLHYGLAIGETEVRFREGLLRGELLGNACSSCACVYVPPRPFCPRCWAPCGAWRSLPDTGEVTAFVVVNVPFSGQEIAIPYVLAHVRVDGADATFFHLVGTGDGSGRLVAPPHGVRAGMRVRARWKRAEERRGLLNDDIDHFEPA